jgi:hypothetical protein
VDVRAWRRQRQYGCKRQVFDQDASPAGGFPVP